MRSIFQRIVSTAVMAAVLGAVAPEASAARVLITEGDVLNIRIVSPAGLFQDETYRVDRLGFINHSIAGKVRLIRITVDQAETLLERLVSDQGHARAIVKVAFLEREADLIESGTSFNISGAVKKPGTYPLTGVVTLADAIRQGGGFTPEANKELVRVKRKGSTMKHMKLPQRNSFKLKPDDEIVVLK